MGTKQQNLQPWLCLHLSISLLSNLLNPPHTLKYFLIIIPLLVHLFSLHHHRNHHGSAPPQLTLAKSSRHCYNDCVRLAMLKDIKDIRDLVYGSHECSFKGYSKMRDDFVTSDPFMVGGYSWTTQFHPLDIGVTLSLNSPGKNVKVEFELILMDQSGKGRHLVRRDSAKISQGFELLWGEYYSMTRKYLKSHYVKNDSLIVCCTLGVYKSCITLPPIVPPPSEMDKNIKFLLDSETGCDIVFRVQDHTFKAHKLILAGRSPVFYAQFYGLLGNPGLDHVDLKDIEAPIFKAMLSYTYSDQFPEIKELSISEATHMIQHLLVAADRFDLDRLKKLCEAKLSEELSVDTVATTLSLAHHHNCSQLKDMCLNFVVANLKAVIKSDGYAYVEKACPLLLSDLIEKMAL